LLSLVGAGASLLAALSSPNNAWAILEALSSSVLFFAGSAFLEATAFFAAGAAATGLRPLFGFSSFSGTLSYGLFKNRIKIWAYLNAF
jgi:hypothetical protein